MKTFKFVIFAFAIITTPMLGYGTPPQHSVLSGPIVASSPVGGGGILFQDIGSGRVWGLTTPTSLYDFFTSTPSSNWSPDGCVMLIRNIRENTWAVLSIADMVITPLQTDLEINSPIWTLDSKNITFTTSNTISTQLYSMDSEIENIELLFEYEGQGSAIAWLSSEKLLYSIEGDWLIWDTDTKQSVPFGTDHFPRGGLPADLMSVSHITQRSPNFAYLVNYYSLRRFNFAIWQESYDGLTKEEFIELDHRVRAPGFTLYELNTGKISYIDLGGAYLQALEWSPSGNYIAITTVPGGQRETESGGIYVYDLDKNNIQQIENFPALADSEYGPYIPTWSADEEWLSFNTPDGYIAYNLLTTEVIKLSGELTDVYMRLAWSPIANYADSECLSTA